MSSKYPNAVPLLRLDPDRFPSGKFRLHWPKHQVEFDLAATATHLLVALCKSLDLEINFRKQEDK